jgi:DNA-binding response OmpR family regulator
MSDVAAGSLGHFPSSSRVDTRVPQPSASRARVLSIEDDASLRQFLVTVLTASGYDVTTASDGRAGLDLARAERPDLILLDLILPYRNGFEVLRDLRQDPHTRAIPVIILSAQGGEEEIVTALEAGADDFLIKPFYARELVARARKALERVGSHAGVR